MKKPAIDEHSRPGDAEANQAHLKPIDDVEAGQDHGATGHAKPAQTWFQSTPRQSAMAKTAAPQPASLWHSRP
jgi:hypothetical protein